MPAESDILDKWLSIDVSNVTECELPNHNIMSENHQLDGLVQDCRNSSAVSTGVTAVLYRVINLYLIVNLIYLIYLQTKVIETFLPDI